VVGGTTQQQQPAGSPARTKRRSAASTLGKTPILHTSSSSRIQDVQNCLAPTFGVSPFKLLPLMTMCIVLCEFDAMPFNVSGLWLIPVVALFLAYHSNQKQRQDRKAALGLVADREILALVVKEMPAWYAK
jgi:hypothetical protein